MKRRHGLVRLSDWVAARACEADGLGGNFISRFDGLGWDGMGRAYSTMYIGGMRSVYRGRASRKLNVCYGGGRSGLWWVILW